MPQPTDYAGFRRQNLASWDERAPAHRRSPGYAVDRFIADPTYLSDVVRFDLPRLGDIQGKRGLHLQCHIGTDTISLSRLGAYMTGLDFSGAAIDQAREIARLTGSDVGFVQADAYDAATVLDTPFDLVFTGIGALCWLPDVRRWAQVIHDLLLPGGRLFLREGHPMLWSLDDRRDDGVLAVTYPYFESEAPLMDVSEDSYVETDQEFTESVSYSWNHGLGEIVGSLLEVGMRITMLEEHRSVPWDALPGHMSLGQDGEYRLNELPDRLPLTYTLQAVREN